MEIENKISSETLDWKKINNDWLKSGLPQKQFCQQHHISYSKFITARSTLVRAGLTASSQPVSLQEQKQNELKNESRAFVPIKMNNPHSMLDIKSEARNPSAIQSVIQSVIEVQLPFGIILRIPTHA